MSKPCSCTRVGYCERHGIIKTAHWYRLCTARTDYRELWDENRGPGQLSSESAANAEKRKESILRSREVWASLHRYTKSGTWNAEAAKCWYFEWWRPRIPEYGCRCRRHWLDLETKFPPDFSSEEAFFIWGFERHNDANRLLGRSDYSLLEAPLDREQSLSSALTPDRK